MKQTHKRFWTYGIGLKKLRGSRDKQKEAREDEKRATEERYGEDQGLSEEKYQSFISYPGEIQNVLSANI